MFVRTTVTDLAGPQIEQRISGFKLADNLTNQMAREFAAVAADRAPRDTGWLIEASTEINRAGGGKIGYTVGPFSKLGNPRSRAPKGTIKKFLEDYPQYAYRMGKTKSVKQRVKRRRRAFPSAWHFLSNEAKLKLRDLRRSGMYGMSGPSPRYWQAVQENRVPGQGGQMGGVNYVTLGYIAAYNIVDYVKRTIFGQ
jgi:hypothetical protein